MIRLASWPSTLLPAARCIACDLAAGEPFCPDCARDFAPADRPRCPQCAAPLPPSPIPTRCGACVAKPPRFDATIALADYEAPIDAMVLALKSGARLDLGRAFGALLARRAAQPIGADAWIVPVPLAFERLRERGFNQALELARPVARILGRRLEPGALVRTRHGPPQRTLDRARRRANLAGAFAARAAFGGREIVLVDDVMTTGSTLEMVARVAKRAGAGRIVNLVVARTA